MRKKLVCRELGEENSGQRGSRCILGRERAWCVGRPEERPGNWGEWLNGTCMAMRSRGKPCRPCVHSVLKVVEPGSDTDK